MFLLKETGERLGERKSQTCVGAYGLWFRKYVKFLYSSQCLPQWASRLEIRATRQYSVSWHRYLHCKDKTIVSPPYLCNGNPILVRCHLYIETDPSTRPKNSYCGIIHGCIKDMCGQRRSFSTHERMFLGKSRIFETESVSTQEGLELTTFWFRSIALTIWATGTRNFLTHVLEYRLWWNKYFVCKVNIWNVNCALTTAFIFDSRTDVVEKMLEILRQKMSRPRRDSNPRPSWK